MIVRNKCVVCGTELFATSTLLLTAHEFKCFKAHPELVPPEWLHEFHGLLEWERRSAAAKKGAAKRAHRRYEGRGL